MYTIGVISASPTLTERFQAEIVEQNLVHFVLRQCDKHQSLDEVRRLIANGARVIISRGQTARAIRNAVDIPVVDVRHTFFDCYNAYCQALNHGGKIAFLATSTQFFQTLRKGIQLMPQAEIVEIHDSDSTETVKERLLELSKRGVATMVGGLTLKTLAEELGYAYVLTGADSDSVCDAIEEANHLLRIEMERDEQSKELANRYETIVSIFQCVSDGVVRIDRNGVIANANDKALQILGTNAIGRALDEMLHTRLLGEVLSSGTAVSGEIINFRKQSLVVNAEPIRVSNEISGAAVTMQQSKHILAAEKKIRSIMVDKGHRTDKTFADIVGNGAIIRETKALAQKYALSDSTVLLLGETGTGKELFAQSIHNASSRSNAPFVAINCASLPLNILESELFGYVKGAFTGARSEGKVGFFELAHHGTIFLDEISETPLEVQLKLLRVLQERKTMRIGDGTLIPVDVRVITASNKDLTQLIRKGLFREDLYYRICVLELIIPPLRKRREDIPALIEFSIRQSAPHIGEIKHAALARILAGDWPGNIRQLQNFIERLGAICDGGVITLEMVEKALDSGIKPAELETFYAPSGRRRNDGSTSLQASANVPAEKTMSEMELIRHALIKVKGNRKLAAERLGISTTTLWRTMKRILAKDATYFDLVKYGTY